MKFFKWSKDGGPESHVTGFFFVEIKSLFSIVLLHFAKGTRETFHSHAFNALTLWLKSAVKEATLVPYSGGRIACTKGWHAGQFKITKRSLMHKIIAPTTGAWALSIRGPWRDTWEEYSLSTLKHTKLTHGRQIIAEGN